MGWFRPYSRLRDAGGASLATGIGTLFLCRRQSVPTA